MKKILFFISLMMIFAAFGEQASAQKISHINGKGCAILDEGVRCWGEDLINPEKVGLELMEPSQVAVATFDYIMLKGGGSRDILGACALDQGQVKCWNEHGFYPVQSESSKVVRIFTSTYGPSHSILVELQDGRLGSIRMFDTTTYKIKPVFDIDINDHASGMHSYVRGYYSVGIKDGVIMIRKGADDDSSTENDGLVPLKDVPYLVRVEKLWAGNSGFCALDQNRYVCWSVDRNGGGEFFNVPRDRELQSLSLYTEDYIYEICFIEKGQVKCPGTRYPVPPLKNPREVVIDKHSICALDDNGPICWGNYTNALSWSMTLENPTGIDGTKGYVCATTAKGLSCTKTIRGWGYGGVDDIERQSKLEMISGPIHENLIGEKNETSSFDQVKAFGTYRGSGRYCQIQLSGKFSCDGDFWRYSGRGKREEITIEDNARPSAFALGMDHVCAIEKNRTRCWGQNDQNQLAVPKGLSSVKEIASGANHSCAIGKNGIQCWGANQSGQTTVPKGLKNPSHLALFGDGSCVMSQSQIKCWGDVGGKFDLSQFNLKNPVNMKFGDNYFCVFDDEGMKCLGSARFIQTVPWMNRILGKVFDMATGDPQTGYLRTTTEDLDQSYFCAIGRQGQDPAKSFCFSLDGMKAQADLMTIRLSPVRALNPVGGEFNLLSLEIKLRELATQTPKLQSEILKKTADFLEQSASRCAGEIAKQREECHSRFQDSRGTDVLGARLLTLNLLAPLMHSMTSKFFKEQINPTYENALISSQQTLGSFGIDYSTGQKSALEKKSALAMAQVTTQMAGKAVRPQDRKRIAMLLTKIVQASVAVKNPALVQAVLSEYDHQRDVFESLKSNYQTSFLAELMEVAMRSL